MLIFLHRCIMCRLCHPSAIVVVVVVVVVLQDCFRDWRKSW